MVIVAVTLLLSACQCEDWPVFLPYAAGSLLIAGISWMDDLRRLPGLLRFVVHLAGAIIATAGLGYWKAVALPFLGEVSLGWWGIPLTILWIVGLTNAYNFMDGTDGMAASQGLVAGFGWALLGFQAGMHPVAGLALILASSCLGFLLHNWPPARIFMGDVGSAFLGYSLALMPLLFGRYADGSKGPLVGLLMVWPFVFDTAYTFLRRLGRRENVFAAHRSHLYQRMTHTPAEHARAALLYSGLGGIGILLAQFWLHTRFGSYAVGLALPALCLGLWAVVAFVFERSS
jgi:UDP-N-acetylmuramyl pentapeptide phosphotransferase/UDP-N-acetylglucosamine-1-phosphate transferase